METRLRLKLTLGQRITHFSILFPLMIPALFSIVCIIEDFFGFYKGKVDIESQYSSAVFFIIIIILLYIIQYWRLYFKKIEITFTESQFQEAVRRTSNELEWEVVKNNKKMFQATRDDLIGAIMGELVTIIKSDGYLLINSICDPNKWTNILPFRNKVNVSVFLKNLHNVTNEVPHTPKISVIENEYSFKRVLFRIIVYPICLLMILGGILMIYYHITLRNALAGVGSIALAVVILYADIKLFVNYKKKKIEKEKNTEA